jgi:hypothetical protein
MGRCIRIERWRRGGAGEEEDEGEEEKKEEMKKGYDIESTTDVVNYTVFHKFRTPFAMDG